MQDIRRSLMIFHLKENFSKNDLQSSYKKLVKKYHPDYNQENQDWSHKKMTEINLAYEQCKELLNNPIKNKVTPTGNTEPETPYPFYQDINRFHSEKKKNEKQSSRVETLTPGYKAAMTETTKLFHKTTDRYYEYGLENRFLRYEGSRKFRYRQCLKEQITVTSSVKELSMDCKSDYDKYIYEVYRDFILYFFQYITLEAQDIPRHPQINPHWNKMEEYLNASLMDYLASFLTDRFGRINWKVNFTHSVNHINYLRRRFPDLNKNSAFKIIVHLAECFAEMREEEEKNKIRFFFP